MGAPTYNEVFDSPAQGLGDPYQIDKWRILSLPTMGSVALSPLACEEVELPFSAYQERSREVATTSITMARSVSVSSFSTRWHMDHYMAILKYFTAWENLIQNPYTGGFRLPSVYKKNIDIGLYNLGGDLVHRHTLRNIWPQGPQGLSLTAAGGRGMLSVQFFIDAVVPETLA